MLLLYTVCVVKRGRASVMVFSLLFFNFSTKRLRKKKEINTMFQAVSGETKASGISVL